MVRKRGGKVPVWRDHHQSILLLERGVCARKYNYSNSDSRQVVLVLTENATSLTYVTATNKGCLA